MCTVARAMLTRLPERTLLRRPLWLWLLGALLVVSTVARLAWIAEPCRATCRSPDDHTLVFDEAYYVNAGDHAGGIDVVRLVEDQDVIVGRSAGRTAGLGDPGQTRHRRDHQQGSQ